MVGEELDSLLVLLALGDVLADAAVTREYAGCVEYGLTGDADPDFLAGFIEPTQFHVSERLVRFEKGNVFRPLVGRYVDVVLLPALLAYDGLEGERVQPFRAGSGHRGEAELIVLLPVHVGGKLGQAAKTLLALAQRLLGRDPLADIPRNGGNDVGISGAQHVARRFEGKRGAILAAIAAVHAGNVGRVRDELVIGALEVLPAGWKDIVRAHPEQFFSGIPEHPAGSLVDVDEAH